MREICHIRRSLLSLFLTVTMLSVISVSIVPNTVLAQSDEPKKAPPYIFGGTITIDGLTIDEYLESLGQFTEYLEIDADFDFSLVAEMRVFQTDRVIYPNEQYPGDSNPVTVDRSSSFKDLIFQPPLRYSYDFTTIYFSLNDIVSDHNEVYNRRVIENSSTDYLSLNFNDRDSDKDGLPDLAERILGLNPNDPDSDADSILDGEEVVPGMDLYVTDPINPDTDGDGLLDGDETKGSGEKNYKSNPLVKDSDSDGILDGEEVKFGADKYITNPFLEDTDGDYITDLQEVNGYGQKGFISDPTAVDSDDDGISDFEEVDLNNGYITDPKNEDSDGDGLSDKDEIFVFKTHPNQRDSDADDLSDGDEVQLGTKPTESDTDGDSISDGEEVISGLDLYITNPMKSDTDGDGIDDGEEVSEGNDSYKTDPVNADTDGDDIPDLEEIKGYGPSGSKTDPTKFDTDGDMISDREEIIGSGPDKYPSDPLLPDSDADGILDEEEVTKGDDNYITDPMNEDTDGDGLTDKEEVIKGEDGYKTDPLNKDTDGDRWSDGTDPWPTTNNIALGLIVGIPVVILLGLVIFQVVRYRRLASGELVIETTPAVMASANQIFFEVAFDQRGAVRTRDAERAVTQATRQIGTKPWPRSAVKLGANTIFETFGVIGQNNQRSIEYLVQFTSHQNQIQRLITQLAEEWWGFIPEDEIWRIAPDFICDGVAWAEHPLAQESIDCAVARAGGVRLISGSLMTRGYRFDEIINRYSK